MWVTIRSSLGLGGESCYIRLVFLYTIRVTIPSACTSAKFAHAKPRNRQEGDDVIELAY